MFETSTLTWTMTMGLVLALFALDLTLGRLRPHRGGFPEAALCSVAHVAVAVAVGAWFLLTHGIDLLFALDSTPAVFGAVTPPFIVFTVNAFVLLGLRALSLLIKVLLERLVGLSAGLAVIIGFIGVTLVLQSLHVDISTAIPETPVPLSLPAIIGVLTIVTVAGLLKTRNNPSRAESADIADLVSTAGSAGTQQVQIARHGR